MTPLRRAAVSGWLALLALLLAGCGGAAGGGTTLTVLAAASLHEPFTVLADHLEEERPGLRVDLVVGSSATLAAQVLEGAPGDVLATADERTMAGAVEAGATAGAPVTFATNTLVLAVPAGGPDEGPAVDAVGDLDDPAVSFLACVPSAPCGAPVADLLRRNGVAAPPRSEEVDVAAVVAKVAAGEADAGVVYASDVVGDPRLRAVPIPGAQERPHRYQAAVLAGATEPAAAQAWLDLLRSPTGGETLADAGFGAVPR